MCARLGVDWESAPNFSHVETLRAHREFLPKGTGVTIIIVVIGLLALIAAAVVTRRECREQRQH